MTKRYGYEVVALSGNPTGSAFTVSPLLARHAISGEYAEFGVDGRRHSRDFASDEEVDAFIAAHCRDVRAAPVALELDPNHPVACWLGAGFAQRCKELGTPLPERPLQAQSFPPNAAAQETAEGLWWVEDAGVATNRLQRWSQQAANAAIRNKSREIAFLMRQCLPHCDETLASVWYTAPSHEVREAETAAALAELLAREMSVTTLDQLQTRLERTVYRVLRESLQSAPLS